MFLVIKALKDCDCCTGFLKRGQVVEIHKDIANYLIERGEAVLTDETPPRLEDIPNPTPPVLETATDHAAAARTRRG